MIYKWMTSKNSLRWLLPIHFTVWMVVALVLDLHPDMSDHWVWSRYLDWGYYEHPPMVAWMMRLVTTILPVHPIISLKIGAVAISTLLLWLAYRAATAFFSRETALIFILILEFTPYFSIGSVFWHIDQPYMICWLLGLWVTARFIQTKNQNWILLFGVIAGFGAVSKYITILFYLALFCWCVLDKRFRYLLLSWRTYVAGLISMAIFSPVFLWNANHDWISFRFQFSRGLKGHNFLGQLPQFTLGHLMLFSIVFATMVWVLLIRKKLVNRPLTEEHSFLLVTGIFPLIFFSVASLRGTVADPHWLNIAYFSMFMILANYMKNRLVNVGSSLYLKYFVSAFVINILVVGITLSQAFFHILPIDINIDPTKRVVAWGESADQIEEALRAASIPEPEFVVTSGYQLGGALALYLENMPFSHSFSKAERNTWSPVEKVKNSDFIMVCPPHICPAFIKTAESRFEVESRLLTTIKTELNGRLVRELSIYAPQKN